MRVAATLLVGTLTLAACTSQPPVEPASLPDVQVPVSDADQLDPGPVDTLPDDAFVGTVYVDGFSQRTVGSQVLTYTLDGDTFQVPLQPVDVQAAEGLVAQWPWVAARAMAHLFSVDAGLRCDDGCADTAGQLPASWLADPSQAEPMGPMYAGWKVDAGLWVAEVPLDPRAARVSFAVGDTDPARFAGPISVAEPGDPEPLADQSAASAVWLLSAGYGQTFVNDPSLWVPDAAPTVSRLTDVPDDGAGVDPADAVGAWFAGGPASDPAVPVAGVSDARLTALSSPAFGCVGALCIPQEARMPVETVAGPETVDGCVDGRDATVVAADVRYAVDLDVPTHIRGAWETFPYRFPLAEPMTGAGRPVPQTGVRDLQMRQLATVVDGTAVSLAAGVWRHGSSDGLTDAADAPALLSGQGLVESMGADDDGC